ncbi:MAG: septal ring lytic transglycosylase RlpA family protein [Polyangia bacterium]
MTPILEAARLLLLAFLGVHPLVADRGMATIFGDPGDLLAGGHLYCTGKKLEPDQLACAHRTLPCGTVLVLENPRTGRFATCEVLDRGPFGAMLDSGDWGFKIRQSDPGTWRGIVDLAPAVAAALDHNGRERIRVYYKALRPHGHRTTRTEFRRMLAKR